MEIIGVLFFLVVIVFIGRVFYQIFFIKSPVDKIFDMVMQQQDIKLKKQQDYNCNNCEATLDNPDDISPSGDVKCKHCNTWFNVYQ